MMAGGLSPPAWGFVKMGNRATIWVETRLTGGYNAYMKGKLILLLVLLLGFGVFLIVGIFVTDATNTNGRLRVDVTPASGVFLDSQSLGMAPGFEQPVKVGEHLLKLIPEQHASASAGTWQKKIIISKGLETVVNMQLGSSDVTTAGVILNIARSKNSERNKGGISVTTDPTNALVYIDNDEKGVSPFDYDGLEKGDHELSVSAPGFVRYTSKVNITPEYTIKAYIKLALDPRGQPLPPSDIKESSSSAAPASTKPRVRIKDTPTGWLRVREEPSINASESAKVKPGGVYDFLEEQGTWYKITYEGTKSGWISSEYAGKE